MKDLSKILISSLLVICGLIAVFLFMKPENSIREFNTWVWYAISYFTVIKPSVEYWIDKLS